MNAHDDLLAPLKREVDAHDYFAHNADLRMTAGDHAKRADNLRAIIAALAAPQADQQGVAMLPEPPVGGAAAFENAISAVLRPHVSTAAERTRACNLFRGWFDHANALRRLAAKPSDQQGVSLEGAVRKALDYLGDKPPGEGCWAAAVATLRTALASKASPDDQRQEGAEVVVCQIGDYGPPGQSEFATVIYDDKKVAECYTNEDAEFVGAALRAYSASPPTEAAAAVGELQAMAANLENSQQQCDEDGCMIQVSRQALVETLALIAALSPTASAAREGSDA